MKNFNIEITREALDTMLDPANISTSKGISKLIGSK